MNPFNDLDHCMCCVSPIHYREYTLTMDTYGIAMCSSCTRDYLLKIAKSEPLERVLYAALLHKGIRGAELQHFDGFKTVDIAILPARLHIEIDGSQHKQARQGLSDLWRLYYSLKQDDIYTMHISNAMVINNVETTADIITKVVSIRQADRA